jgi:hypothetical protein
VDRARRRELQAARRNRRRQDSSCKQDEGPGRRLRGDRRARDRSAAAAKHQEVRGAERPDEDDDGGLGEQRLSVQRRQQPVDRRHLEPGGVQARHRDDEEAAAGQHRERPRQCGGINPLQATWRPEGDGERSDGADPHAGCEQVRGVDRD